MFQGLAPRLSYQSTWSTMAGLRLPFLSVRLSLLAVVLLLVRCSVTNAASTPFVADGGEHPFKSLEGHDKYADAKSLSRSIQNRDAVGAAEALHSSLAVSSEAVLARERSLLGTEDETAQLEIACHQVSIDDTLVILTILTEGALDLFYNWATHLLELELEQHFVAFAQDRTALDAVNRLYPNQAVLFQPAPASGSPGDYHEAQSEAFQQLAGRRARYIRAVVELGYSALFLDLDALLLKDPRPFLGGGAFDVRVMAEDRVAEEVYERAAGGVVVPLELGRVGWLSSGVVHFNATAGARRVLDAWAALADASLTPRVEFRRVLLNDALRAAGGVRAGLLPPRTFAPGWCAFAPGFFEAGKSELVAVHNSWNVDKWRKRARFQQVGLWKDEVSAEGRARAEEEEDKAQKEGRREQGPEADEQGGTQEESSGEEQAESGEEGKEEEKAAEEAAEFAAEEKGEQEGTKASMPPVAAEEGVHREQQQESSEEAPSEGVVADPHGDDADSGQATAAEVDSAVDAADGGNVTPSGEKEQVEVEAEEGEQEEVAEELPAATYEASLGEAIRKWAKDGYLIICAVQEAQQLYLQHFARKDPSRTAEAPTASQASERAVRAVYPEQVVRIRVEDLREVHAQNKELEDSAARNGPVPKDRLFAFSAEHPYFVRAVLDHGVNVIYSDVDTVWLHSPMHYFSGDYDLYVQYDAIKLNNNQPLSGSEGTDPVQQSDVGKFCSCVLHARSTAGGKRVVEQWIRQVRAHRHTGKGSNQPYFNQAIGALLKTGDAPKIGLLPQTRFPPGWLFFGNKDWAAANKETVAIAHNNWVFGHKRKYTNFQETGTWFVDTVPGT
eukprot:jgi/Mesen1/1978/ME000147S01073